MSVPNFKILSLVVSEKSLTEKSLQTDKQTHRLTDKHSYRKGKNYIPPIYFVCRGYKYHFFGLINPYVYLIDVNNCIMLLIVTGGNVSAPINQMVNLKKTSSEAEQVC